MELSDILVFISDQHGYSFSGFGGDPVIRTPNMDSLAAQGVCFDSAYTSCPLCVPARISLLTGQLPSTSGAFSNGCAIPFDKATLMHSLAARGYETVICGRMHFMGPDQYHGFTKRIMGELLTSYWGRNSTIENDLERFHTTFTEKGCLKLTGCGYSPVQAYDEAVIAAALDYLSQPHEKPQCLVVGTYGPHFSYVAPPELYHYYRERVSFPHTDLYEPNYRHPALVYKEQHVASEKVLSARAAYFGMVESIDMQLGVVYNAFSKYLSNSGHEGLFIYLSDHGDQVGERYLFGKQTFFEQSVKIPFIVAGSGVKKGLRVSTPVSICDVAPTLLDYADADQLPGIDGQSLMNCLRGEPGNPCRSVNSEYVLTGGPCGEIPGRMVVKDGWKLISYAGYQSDDLLFNLKEDRFELNNVCEESPQIYREMKNELEKGWDVSTIMQNYRRLQENHHLLGKWCDIVNPPDERWIPHIPPVDKDDMLLGEVRVL